MRALIVIFYLLRVTGENIQEQSEKNYNKYRTCSQFLFGFSSYKDLGEQPKWKYLL